ncbi:flavin reductase family protein [Pseudodonghicola flavimaris]|uniref:Flavin reductase family protein n=1 Tax=Pseudodonghicola flavimaris TaxID=3050036 RepID=A0ABT7F3Z5_9RHOB|nr:flavin reductase family protein [Pseudodonghicola flavimaris]MDK3019154.1 flavin reductase family protein [Pseudodonghicola flavimaris]
MTPYDLGKVFTLMESGPVVLVTTNDGQRDNVMTITWTMVLDFAGTLAITTGPWNHSFGALRRTRECVIALPPVDMLDQVIGVGTCSGSSTDKFEAFGLTRRPAERVRAPLIAEALANIECRVVEMIEPYTILVLQAEAAWTDPTRAETRLLHAVGDGTFITDGERLDRRAAMRNRLPPGF